MSELDVGVCKGLDLMLDLKKKKDFLRTKNA